jgi:hypothetical protein
MSTVGTVTVSQTFTKLNDLMSEQLNGATISESLKYSFQNQSQGTMFFYDGDGAEIESSEMLLPYQTAEYQKGMYDLWVSTNAIGKANLSIMDNQ